MAYLKEEEIQSIRQSADIVDIVSSYVSLSPKGKNFVGICPFHDDHSPSMVVSPDRQIFNCFTCRTGGNVFAFVMKYENVGFLEAVKIICEKIGYNLKLDNYATDFSSKYKNEYEIMEFAKKYFVNNMNTAKAVDAKKYLSGRGINESIIKEFNIGLALDEKDTLYRLLSNKKYELDTIDGLGLINKYGIDVYDSFQNRIMIPIEDLKGQVVGFTGRIFHGEDTAKYINTKETIIFKKGSILFNYHNAKNEIRNSKKVIVVEGNMDAITVSAHGIKNVVALMGVALSSEQIDTLRKLKVPVVLSLDNDNAGVDATIKLGEQLMQHGVDAYVIRYSGAKDPDEYIRKFGADAYLENINHAMKYIDFKLEFLKENKNLDQMEDLISYVKQVISSLKSADDLTKELVISKISKDYEVDVGVLKKELEGQSVNVKKEVKQEKTKEKKIKGRYEIAASKVLFAMMNDSKYIAIYKKRLGFFKEKKERILAAEIVYYNNEHGSINLADFTSYLMESEDVFQSALEIIGENATLDVDDAAFSQYIDAILQEYKKDEIKELKMQIKNTTDINKKVELIEKLRDMKKGSVE